MHENLGRQCFFSFTFIFFDKGCLCCAADGEVK